MVGGRASRATPNMASAAVPLRSTRLQNEGASHMGALFDPIRRDTRELFLVPSGGGVCGRKGWRPELAEHAVWGGFACWGHLRSLPMREREREKGMGALKENAERGGLPAAPWCPPR